MPRTLIVLRHGETPWNVEGRLQGQTEVAMSDVGRAQAKRNGRALCAYLTATARPPESLDFLSSPIGRASDTMRLLRAEMGLDPGRFEIQDGLREITFGTWEGSTMSELKACDKATVDARKTNKWGFVPPQGESYAMLSRRVAQWLATIGGDTVAVTHGGVIRVLRGLLLGAPERPLAARSIPQDRILVVTGRCGSWI